jgi:hypothetical protein
MLDVVPGGSEAEHCATAGKRVERRRQLREERWIAVRDPGDERSELNAARLTGEAARVVQPSSIEGEAPFGMEDGEGKPSRWNTLRAMRVLDWFST